MGTAEKGNQALDSDKRARPRCDGGPIRHDDGGKGQPCVRSPPGDRAPNRCGQRNRPAIPPPAPNFLIHGFHDGDHGHDGDLRRDVRTTAQELAPCQLSARVQPGGGDRDSDPVDAPEWAWALRLSKRCPHPRLPTHQPQSRNGEPLPHRWGPDSA